MKQILLSAIVIAAMASCSKNEVIKEFNSKPIGFERAQWGNSVETRTSANLDNTVALGVFAYEVAGNPSALFIDDVLSYQSNAWKLSTTYYWPEETNAELQFYAYGPKKDNNGITSATCAVSGTPAFTYTVTGVPGAQTDVIVDLAGKKQSSGTVTFMLNHVLTRLQFKAQLSASPNPALTVKINSIKVEAPSSADFAIATGAATWSGHAATNTDYMALNSETAVSAVNGSAVVVGSFLNMIPASTTARIIVLATAYDATTGTKVGEKTIAMNCDGTTSPSVAVWVAGTEVTYTLTLDPDNIAKGSGNAIEFGDPVVNQWAPGSGNIDM